MLSDIFFYFSSCLFSIAFKSFRFIFQMIFRKKLVTFWQISTLVTLPVTASMMSSAPPALMSLCHPLAPLLLDTYSFVPDIWMWTAFLLLYVHCFSLCSIISHCIFIPCLPFPIILACSVFQRLAILALWICSVKGIGLIGTWFPLYIFWKASINLGHYQVSKLKGPLLYYLCLPNLNKRISNWWMKCLPPLSWQRLCKFWCHWLVKCEMESHSLTVLCHITQVLPILQILYNTFLASFHL